MQGIKIPHYLVMTSDKTHISLTAEQSRFLIFIFQNIQLLT